MKPRRIIDDLKRSNQILQEKKAEQHSIIKSLEEENKGLVLVSARLAKEADEHIRTLVLLQSYIDRHLGPNHVYTCLAERDNVKL